MTRSLVLKQRKGLRFVIPRRQLLTLPASIDFALTVPQKGLNLNRPRTTGTGVDPTI